MSEDPLKIMSESHYDSVGNACYLDCDMFGGMRNANCFASKIFSWNENHIDSKHFTYCIIKYYSIYFLKQCCGTGGSTSGVQPGPQIMNLDHTSLKGIPVTESSYLTRMSSLQDPVVEAILVVSLKTDITFTPCLKNHFTKVILHKAVENHNTLYLSIWISFFF